MFRGRKAPLIGTLGVLAALAVAGGMFFSSGEATAQQNTNGLLPNFNFADMTFSARYINEIRPSSSSDKVEEVIPFPHSPVFLVRTKNAITVWERRGSNVRTLLDIPLEETLRSLQILEDGRTFVIQTDEFVRVYSVEGHVPQTNNRNNARR